MLGSCFVFSCVVCNCLDDGVRGAEDENKSKVGEKLSTKVFSLRKVLCCGWQ
jgi:hypothetical protein